MYSTGVFEYNLPCEISGGIIASAITYGTGNLSSSWAGSIPSIIQIVPSLLYLVTLPFIPELPRWLMY